MTTHTCMIALGPNAQLSLLETDAPAFVDLYEALGAYAIDASGALTVYDERLRPIEVWAPHAWASVRVEYYDEEVNES